MEEKKITVLEGKWLRSSQNLVSLHPLYVPIHKAITERAGFLGAQTLTDGATCWLQGSKTEFMHLHLSGCLCLAITPPCSTLGAQWAPAGPNWETLAFLQ